jgi:hypothetical protein
MKKIHKPLTITITITAALLTLTITTHTNATQPASLKTPTATKYIPGANTVHVKPTKGKCSEGVKRTMSKKQRITYERANGTTFTKIVKKGTQVCSYPKPTGEVVTAAPSVKPPLTKLPANFPKVPTAADIEGLGLSQFDEGYKMGQIRIPQPKIETCTQSQLVKSVTPRVIESTKISDTERKATIEWTIVGGAGVLDTEAGRVVLDPNGTTKVTIESTHDTTGIEASLIIASLSPDCGQSSLPDELIFDWIIPSDTKWGVGIDSSRSTGPNYFNMNPDGTIRGA